ncbi:MAG: adenylate/guanylate cyclase domain-containing protein [Chitinophagales bacterium]
MTEQEYFEKIAREADPLIRADLRVNFANEFPDAAEETILEVNTSALEDLLIKPDKLLEAKASVNIANCYMTLGYVIRAFEYDQRAYIIGEELGLDKLKAITLNNLGNNYSDMDKYEEALSHFKKALEINLRSDFGENFLAANYSNIGSVYSHTGQFQSALEHFEKAVPFNKKNKNYDWLGANYIGIARCLAELGRVKDGITILTDAIIQDEFQRIPNRLASMYEEIAACEVKQRNFEKAVEHNLKSLEVNGGRYHDDQILALSRLANCYYELGQYQKAFDVLKEAKDLERKRFLEDNTKQIENLKAVFDAEQRRKEAELLRVKAEELETKNRIIEEEKQRSDKLLLNILPGEVAEELKLKGTADARLFNNVTVMFTDFKSFTNISERLSPQRLVDELHTCFKAFDEITTRHNIEKIKTVGDAYLAVAGLPVPDDEHAINMVRAALEIRNFMLARREEMKDQTFEVRIGIHTGSVVAGIVGVKKFAYDIWGDTVNTAARMEQSGVEGEVNVSEATFKLIGNRFPCSYRGEIEVKNKGVMKMYLVEGASTTSLSANN